MEQEKQNLYYKIVKVTPSGDKISLLAGEHYSPVAAKYFPGKWTHAKHGPLFVCADIQCVLKYLEPHCEVWTCEVANPRPANKILSWYMTVRDDSAQIVREFWQGNDKLFELETNHYPHYGVTLCDAVKLIKEVSNGSLSR